MGAMPSHSSDLKAAIEEEYKASESDSFVDNPDERALSGYSSCYASKAPAGCD